MLIAIAIVITSSLGCEGGGDEEANNQTPPEKEKEREKKEETENPNSETDEFAICDVTSLSKLTFGLDQPEHAFQLRLFCDTVPQERQFGDAITFRGERARTSETTLDVDGLECNTAEDLHSCSLSLSGLTSPEGTPQDTIGLEVLTLEDTSGQQLEAPIRWALSAQQIADLVTNRDISELPPAFLARSLDLHVKETEITRIVAGTMRTADGDGIELFTINAEGAVTIHETIDVNLDDLTHFGSDMALAGGKIEFEWWGFDGDSLQGTSLIFTLEGDLESTEPLDFSTYSGSELTELLGITFHRGDAPGGQRLHGTALMRTADNTVAVVALGNNFDTNGVILNDWFSAENTNWAGEVSGGQVGLTSIQNTPRIWYVDEAKRFNLITTSGEPLGSAFLDQFGVQYPFELRIRAASDTRLFVETTWEDQNAFASIEVDGEGMVNGRIDHLEVPENCRPDGRDILASTSSSLTIICNEIATGAPLRVEWTGLTGQPGETPAAPTSVTPLVATRHSGLTAGDVALRTVLADGTMRLNKLSDLSTTCTNPGDCSLPITDFTPDGWRLNLAPGTTSPTWSVATAGNGDILIDGVPLCCEGPAWEGEGGEVDLSLTSPPIIVDAPGATASDDVAMILGNINGETITHATWTVSAHGEISAPSLLKIDTGDPNTGVVFQNAESEDKGDDDEAQEMTLTIATTIIDFRDNGEGNQDGNNERPSGTFTIPASQIAQAIDAGEPLTLSTEDPAFTLSDTPAHTLVSAPATRIATEDFSGGENAEVLATLTAAQAARPLTFTYGADGLVMRGSGDDGDDPLEVLIDENPLALDNPIFVAGTGSNPLNQASSDGSGFSGKIKRIRIKQRRVGSNFRSSSSSGDESEGDTDDVAYEVVLEELSIPAELATEELHLLKTGDFNGDGFEDLVVRSSERAGSLILFDDGNGGLSHEILELPGGPTTVYTRGANARVAGTGSDGVSCKKLGLCCISRL